MPIIIEDIERLIFQEGKEEDENKIVIEIKNRLSSTRNIKRKKKIEKRLQAMGYKNYEVLIVD